MFLLLQDGCVHARGKMFKVSDNMEYNFRRCPWNKKYLKKIYDFLADVTHKLNPVRSSRLILNWYDFYEKIVFQWFIRLELNSVYLILNILRRKELENLNNFSVKITPNLKIADFLITICEF